MGFMWLLWTIVIGILAGWIAGRIMKGHDMGLAIDLLVGIVGAVLGVYAAHAMFAELTRSSKASSEPCSGAGFFR